jgi:hypothetical protein
MATQNRIPYKSSLEDVMSKYQVHILDKSSYQTKSEKDIANRNIRIAKNYDKVKARLLEDNYDKVKGRLLENKDVKIFRETYYTNMGLRYYKVVNVLKDGYYLISKSSKIYRLYAPTLSMVDKDVVPNIFVKKTGVYKYENTAGSKSTVESYIMLAYCYD